MNSLWQVLADRAHLTLSQQQIDQFSHYIDLLLAANQTMNLTRIDTRETAEVGHVGDALTLLPFLPTGVHRLADVGSGGGIPGIPLAIARPDTRIVLFESTKKKAAFLEDAVRLLGLSRLTVSSERAEVEAHGASREIFDVVVARALAAMNILVEWCLPLVRPGGRVLAMKGGRISEELPAAARAIKTLGGGQPIVHPVDLPGTDYHVVVEIPKILPTSRQYPRSTAQSKDRPL